MEKERRKNYTLDPELSRELARQAINLSEELEKTVHRQDVLDALVANLKDKGVFAKVKNTLKST